MKKISLILSLFIILLSGTSFVFSIFYDKNKYELEISSNINDCAGNAELFINSLTKQPANAEIQCGKDNLLIFPIYENIEFIRIDFGNKGNNVVKIYEINIKKNKKTSTVIKSISLKDWTTNELKLLSADNNAISFITTGSDPFLYKNININIGKSNNLLFNQLNDSIKEYIYQIIAITLIVLLILIIKFSNIFIAEVLIISFLSIFGSLYLFKNLGISSSTSTAVGSASYFGFNFLNLLIPLYLSIIPVLSYVYLRNKSNSIKLYDKNESTIKFNIYINSLVFIFLLFYFSINPFEILNNSSSRIINPDWDGNNMLYWSYLIKNGYLPYKDFWYPYFGHFLFEIGFGYGELINSLYKVFIFYNLFLVLNIIFKKNILFSLFSTILIIILNNNYIFWGADRYLLSIIFLLSSLIYLSNSRNFVTSYLVISSFIMITLIDTPQLIYSIITLSIIILCNITFNNRKFIDQYKLNYILFSIYLIIIILLFLIILIRCEMLDGVLAFISTLNSMSIYSQVPRDASSILSNPLSLSSVWLTVPLFLFSASIYIYFYGSNRLGQYLLALSVLTLFIMNKHIIRSLDRQMLIFFFIWALLLISEINYKKTYFKYIIIVIMTVTLYLANFSSMLTKIITGPTNVYSTIKFFLHGNEYIDIFTDKNLVKFVKERNFITNIKNKMGSIPDFYSFSDNQVLYILANNRPFFNNNIYNQSPIDDQNTTIRQLEMRKTSLVVIDADQLTFDLVPNYLRLPLLFSYIIHNYSYVYRYENLFVFQRSSNQDKNNLIALRELYGNNIDLKYFPTYSKLQNRIDCVFDCEKFIQIKIPKENVGKSNVEISFEIDKLTYTLQFKALPFKDTYYINVKNIWFIDLALKNNLKIDIKDPFKMTIFESAINKLYLY